MPMTRMPGGRRSFLRRSVNGPGKKFKTKLFSIFNLAVGLGMILSLMQIFFFPNFLVAFGDTTSTVAHCVQYYII